MQFFKIILPVFLGFFLGASLVLLHICSHDVLQQHIIAKLQHTFENYYDCSFECRPGTIDWPSLRMHFSDIVIRPKNASKEHEPWSIVIDSCTARASWWTLLTKFKLQLSSKLQRVIMHEKKEDGPSLLTLFLAKLFKQGSASFIGYDSITIDEGLLFIQQNNTDHLYIPYHCNMGFENNGIRLQLYMQDGSLKANHIDLIDRISGSVVGSFPYKNSLQNISGSCDLSGNIVALQQQGHCLFSGSIKQGIGTFLLKQEHDLFTLYPIEVHINEKGCFVASVAKANADTCKKIYDVPLLHHLNGSISITCHANLYDPLNSLQATAALHNLCYHQTTLLPQTTATVHATKLNTLTGQLFLGSTQFLEILLHAHKNTLKIEGTNNQDLLLPADVSSWKIPAKKCTVTLHYHKNSGWSGSYSIGLQNNEQKEKNIKGTFLFDGQKITLQGLIDTTTYEIIMNLDSHMLFEKILAMQDKNKVIDFAVDAKDPSQLQGTIDFTCIKALVGDVLKPSFTQEGKLQLRGFIKDGIYYAQAQTKQANIRIPKIYNLVQDITASCQIDLYRRTITCKDIKAQLHEGEIACSQATFGFDTMGTCTFMHIPCMLHNVLMSWDKGIFMLISGAVVAQKFKEKPAQIDAQIIIEKSQFKENILSNKFQETLFGSMLEQPQQNDSNDQSASLNVGIFTKDALQVTTSFLETQATLDLALTGTIKKPELTGSMDLLSGSFYFPYKPLDITHGKLSFIPDQHLDPIIEMTAKNKLKRFYVTMHVTGSIFNPTVQFEATPYLPEDQIISLLLLGIEDNSSLNVVMPALLTQKLQELVFGPALSKIKLQSKFEKLLQSLKYFRFLPQFTNQTGRGGIRGIFEVDATDQLHGKMDMNFMQLEDTKFDIGYDVTDDITLRAQKDGPSTYGGEVEFKWKFG